MSFNAPDFLRNLCQADSQDAKEPVPSVPSMGPAEQVSPAALANLSMDQRVSYEERAAVREYLGGLPRNLAEILALRDVLSEQ